MFKKWGKQMTGKTKTDRQEKENLSDFLHLRPAGFSQELRDGLVASHSRATFIIITKHKFII
jgi:hypothetical protein